MTINERASLTERELQQIIETDHVQCGDAAALARELQQYRAAAKPACYALTNSAGEVYNTHSSPENAEAYRMLIHQSDDTLTLRVTPLYAAPQLTSAEREELEQYRAAEPVLYCMEGDTLDEENVSTSKAVVDAWVEEWNGEGRCPGEPQYRTVPLYRHAAPQVTSETERLAEQARAVIHCLDMCGVPSGCYADNPQLILWGRVIEYANTPVAQVTSVPDGLTVAREIIKEAWRLIPQSDTAQSAEWHTAASVFLNDFIAAPAVQAEPLSVDTLTNALRNYPAAPTDNQGKKRSNSPAIPDGWIPVSERMPETMVSVLATGDWFDYAVTAWSGKEWLDFDDYEPPVTHWMPLPAAPKREAE